MRRDQSAFETVTSSPELYSTRCTAAPLREISVRPSLWQTDATLEWVRSLVLLLTVLLA